MNLIKSIELEITGLGFIVYSPFCTAHIPEDENYFRTGGFDNPSVVEKQALNGGLVGVCTSTPGKFIFEFYYGYPNEELLSYEFRLRLCAQVKDNMLCIRDLYELLEWSSECPEEQIVELDDGIYHITLLSCMPISGILGDNQKILVFLQALNEIPQLRYNGVPTLC